MTFNFEEVIHILHFLELIKFILQFYFTSSDQSEMVEWLKIKSLMRNHLYPRFKTVTKTFLENVQQKSGTC